MEMPSNLLPPQTFAREIEESLSQVSCGETSLRVVVHDKDWIEKQNMGGVLGVSRASSQDPCFVEINYVGDPSRPNDHIALVGKGVTFDSGGISIKPAGGMEAMRADMGGAAVMASVVLALAQLQSPINIRVYLPLVENMPDGNALRPGDVLRMASGTTVQVDNTDAEGRLILADALHYAQSNPDAPNPPLLIIDAATLTGAISVSLGDHYTGLFCNQAVQRRRVTDVWPKEGDRDPQQHQQHPLPPTIIGSLNYCGRQKCDPFWHMPTLYSKHLQEGCHLADISNITTGSFARLGGSGSASAFLQAEFRQSPDTLRAPRHRRSHEVRVRGGLCAPRNDRATNASSDLLPRSIGPAEQLSRGRRRHHKWRPRRRLLVSAAALRCVFAPPRLILLLRCHNIF
uniref:Cytosol aminopeptidase n=1 Tax=Mesocestoides corti TaxID=53468 RepID=A0A5K3FX18_MESCO